MLRPGLPVRLLASLALCAAATAGAAPAEQVYTGGRIYTSVAGAPLASALAVDHGRIVYVGTDAGAKAFIGHGSRVTKLRGAFVMPGLVDAHLHPLDIVDLDFCDLDSKPMSLRDLSQFVRGCIARFHPADGERLLVHQWNYTAGNEPDAEYPTLRVALDKASTTHQVQLLGNDGHHSAFNSLGLAAARDAQNRVVGYTAATLAKEFAAYRKLVGVDSNGEPNGAVNEDARLAINEHSMLNSELEAVVRVPERVPQRLNSVGITAIMDAMAVRDSQQVYDSLLSRGALTMRVQLAQFFDPERYHTSAGAVDYDTMVRQATETRAKYAGNTLLHADFIKLFADGVTEGNPLADPPTLPNAASLKPYLQPIFGRDGHGEPTVTGYVDTASPACVEARANPARYADAAGIAAFRKANGYHPGQCVISDGQLQHERDVELEFVKRFHLAGFNLHIHAIGDRGLRTALDAIEAARAADGVSSTRDSLAHLQITTPEDVARVGRDRLYCAFTFAWANEVPEYDITAIPFYQKVSGNTLAGLHPAGNAYDRNVYPARSVKAAGGIIVGGSDAPVETRDPRPFLNISRAITRRLPGLPPLNAGESLGVDDALAAYTINGARMLGIDRDAGSLEVGKSADFVVLDRDPLALAAAGKAGTIAGTRVRQTWFQGKLVYEGTRPAKASAR